MKSGPLALIILDGFGYSTEPKYNAIAQAKKPTIDFLLAHFPNTLLDASGNSVGLPDGYIGNSEVGHETMGAGRIIPSAFLRLYNAIEDGTFFTNPILIAALDELAQTNRALHILGILSNAGVQCHEKIIQALIYAGVQHKIKKIVIHAFLDGRDVAPKSAATFLHDLEEYCKAFPQVSLGSITGRYYATDRDKHWDRTQKAYENLITSNAQQFTSWQEALSYYYAKGITDEYIPPTTLQANSDIKSNDGVIFANFREDRARQLTACFIAPQLTSLVIKDPFPLLFFISAVRYDPRFTNPVLLEVHQINNTLKELISKEGKTIFSIAETEKYAHITYFFGGGHEKPFSQEKQILIPSLPVKNYKDHPQMSAQKITDAVINSLQKDPYDFYLINYANADMVGHTGNLLATISAIECLDHQLAQLYEQIVIKMNGTLMITADHGNAELKFNEKTQQPQTAHTTNKVPFIWVKNELRDKKINLPLHGLADIAPFIIKQFKDQKNN
jgi:2,3-bisphosphoglycerate-independent phosphoglycerate mutase